MKSSRARRAFPLSSVTAAVLTSLLVRKRYIGDYNHSVLSSRASGAYSF